MLSKEEADERFTDADENQDGKVTWSEYVGTSLGSSEEDDADGDKVKQNNPLIWPDVLWRLFVFVLCYTL